MFRAFFIALSESRMLRSVAERSAIGRRLSSRFVAGMTVEDFHSEDQVRLILSGEGIFDVRDENDRWIRIEVGTGDMIVIPARTYRFYLTDMKQIRCMRLFANHDGWAPLYRASA